METIITEKVKQGEALKFFLESLNIESDECINWKHSKERSGYGLLWNENKMQYVHRLSLTKKIGKAPDNKPYALHSCHNPKCFNYRHLRWGSQTENCADKIKDGTNITPRGSAHGRSKLTEEQIISIRKDIRLHREIAKDYCVGRPTISKIKSGKIWAWLK